VPGPGSGGHRGSGGGGGPHAGLAAAPALASSGGYTLVSGPASSVCRHSTIKVGVWAQAGTSRADRRYFVDVWGPTGDHSFHSQGYAPESPQSWRIWYVKGLEGRRLLHCLWHLAQRHRVQDQVLHHIALLLSLPEPLRPGLDCAPGPAAAVLTRPPLCFVQPGRGGLFVCALPRLWAVAWLSHATCKIHSDLRILIVFKAISSTKAAVTITYSTPAS